ncbi:MAG: hypothetical protein K2X87_29515 [Gemmataceae bacterium]|nr:hypothetical protein [Gemmataceae bacterium]
MRPAAVVFFLSASALLHAVVSARAPSRCQNCFPLLFDPADDPAPAVKAGGLSAPAPAGWVSEKPANRLRSHQFKLPGEKDGPGDAELIVFPESDPKTEKVFPRWKAQFVPPDGKTADDISTVSKLDGTKGATITLLDVSGTWKYRAAPFDPKSKEELREDQRVVWAVVAGSDEAAHVRLSGPKATVDKHYPVFEKWLKSLK